MDRETTQLVMDVMDGNPGALSVIQQLMMFRTLWHPMLHHLKSQGVIGSELWRQVRDDYAADWRRFGYAQMAQMGLEAITTTSLAVAPEWPRSN